MKKIIIVLICGVLVLGITGCKSNSKNEFKIGEKSDIQISKNYVSMEIKEGTLKNTGATLVLTNNSDKVFHYGNPYKIEVKQDGEWHKINVELNFTMPAFGLKANESKEIELNWKHGYGKLTKGTYRIIKDIDHYREKTDNYETFKVATEFTIE